MRETLKSWLSGPKEYDTGLDLLAKHSKNVILLNTLKKKETRTNRSKLEYLIKKILNNMPVNDPVPAPKTTPLPETLTQSTPTVETLEIEPNTSPIDALQIEQGKLYNERCDLSNKLHLFEPHDNDGRKKIVELILDCIDKYNRNAETINYYINNGKMPEIKPVKQLKDYSLDELIREKRNISANITKAKKQLDKNKRNEVKQVHYRNKMAQLKARQVQIIDIINLMRATNGKG